MKNNRTLKISLLGILTALTTVATIIIVIPIPSTDGYVNFGDTIIFLTACLMGGVPAMLVGGIGSALADLIVAPHWAIFTLVIKSIEGLVAGLLMSAFKMLPSALSKLIALFIAALWMVLGYYFAGAIMYGWAGSLASVPMNLLQAGVSLVLGFALWITLSKIKPLNNVLERLK
ncbi:MAG: ECF transporter S component [Clostridia bacterium]